MSGAPPDPSSDETATVVLGCTADWAVVGDAKVVVVSSAAVVGDPSTSGDPTIGVALVGAEEGVEGAGIDVDDVDDEVLVGA